MLYKEDVKIRQPQNRPPVSERPQNCEDLKACLKQALKILEERYKV